MLRVVPLGFVVAVITLCFTASCSGPGVPVAVIRQVSVQQLASDHVSAVLLLKGWLKIMYVKSGAGESRCQLRVRSRQLPGGARRVWGTMSDCTTFDYQIEADGSGQGTMTYADGGVETILWGTPVWDGPVHRVDIAKLLPDGTIMDFTHSADYSQPEVPVSLEGSTTLADGRRMNFELNRRTQVSDELRLRLPDGSALEATVPLTSVQHAVYWPIFDPGGTGSFVGADGHRLDFNIRGSGDGWDRWVFTTDDGFRGEFNLLEGLAGNGTLTREGVVIGALRWPQDGFGTLDLVGAGSAEITPSAAARDFQIDRWVANLAAMGPAPMY